MFSPGATETEKLVASPAEPPRHGEQGGEADFALLYLFGSGRNLERAKGFEPSTPTLARLCSTPELRPLERPLPAALMPVGRGEARG